MLDYGSPQCLIFKNHFPEEWDKFGCGPGGFGDFLVPDTMWGLCVTEACAIHDWFYRFYPNRSPEAKQFADQLLLQNALYIVNENSKYRISRRLRIVRCHTYYFMVKNFGQSSWDECKSIRDKK